MITDLTPEERAYNFETMLHMARVRNLLNIFVYELLHRGERHDLSKIERPEVTILAAAPSLHGIDYGSEAYAESKRIVAPALEHHYANNRHHPEHFKTVDTEEIRRLVADIVDLEECEDLSQAVKARLVKRLKDDVAALSTSVNGMNLVDIVEMFLDWKASSERHATGNIRKSIEHNAGKFGLSPQLVRIMENTVELVQPG